MEKKWRIGKFQVANWLGIGKRLGTTFQNRQISLEKLGSAKAETSAHNPAPIFRNCILLQSFLVLKGVSLFERSALTRKSSEHGSRPFDPPKMALNQLDSSALGHILAHLDTQDILQLVVTGDLALRAHLKPAMRDFVIRIETRKSPRLSSLLNLVKTHASNPRRFSIVVGKFHEQLRFVPEDHDGGKWKSVFPQDLEALDLSLEFCDLPFSSLFASLSIAAHKLKSIRCLSIPRELTLPTSLTKIEFGSPIEWHEEKRVLNHPTLFQRLPSTLTSLKLHNNLHIHSDIAAEHLLFKKLPLTVFHAIIHFRSLNEDDAQWSILPNTIVDLSASFTYGQEETIFEPPTEQTWAQLFPNLTSLNVPVECLAEDSLIQGVDPADRAQSVPEQLASAFPASLTVLNTSGSRHYNYDDNDVPIVIRALGDRLKTFSFERAGFNAYSLQSLPHWENPKVMLFKTQSEFGRISLAGGENYENFLKEDHPVSRLCRTATSLHPRHLPASAIALIPKTIKTLGFQVMAQDPITVQSASDATERSLKSGNANSGALSVTSDFNRELAWTQLGWPTALTNLSLTLMQTSLHLGCLPTTITELQLLAPRGFIFEGGNLAHMKQLTSLSIQGPPTNGKAMLESLNDFPKSLRSISLASMSCADNAFDKAEFQKFFENLEQLILDGPNYSADVLIHLSASLKHIELYVGPEGAGWSEKHWEGIARTQAVYLALDVAAQWPETLKFDVFSKYLPKTLGTLNLNISDWNGKGFEQEIAQHIPGDLPAFNTPNPKLATLVMAKIQQK